MRHAAVVSVIALALAALPAGLAGQSASGTLIQGRDDTRAQRIFSILMSPYCPGLTVASCPSPGAERIRQEIRRRLAAGEEQRTIVAALVDEYGEGMLGAPPVRRWGLALWIPPVAMLVFGGGALARWLRRRGSPPARDEARSPALEPEVDPALQSRLDEALQAFDREV